MTERDGQILRLAESDLPQVVEVLADSFFDYPVMRFVLDPAAPDYGDRLRTLVRFFALSRVLRGEILLGAGARVDLDGVALVSLPAGTSSPHALGGLREQMWGELGPEARGRYETCAAAWSRFDVDVPHIHLNMLGVRRRAAGRGMGRLLIDHVHAISRQTPDSRGVTLSTEDPANVPLYEHLGYRIIGHAGIAPGLETWGFFRPD